MDMDARHLVPGDVISLKLGDVVPADCVLLDGPPLEIDQVRNSIFRVIALVLIGLLL